MEQKMKTYANLGLFFQRGYYDDLTAELLPKELQNNDVGNNNKEDENLKKKQSNYFEERNSTLKDSSKNAILEKSNIKGTVSFELKTVYPGLITGIGMAHATGMEGEGKLGMTFDFTSGLPYIPGSSVKGLLRSLFPILPPNKSENKISEKTKELLPKKRQYICEVWNKTIMSKWNEQKKAHPEELPLHIFEGNSKYKDLQTLEDQEIEELAKLIFEGKNKNGSYLPIYDRDIFFDALIGGYDKEKGILDFDYITPHKDELKNPTPIKFLKILPNVSFVFEFKLGHNTLSSEKVIPDITKKWLFQEILTTVGIGAKTNVGYGQLKTVKI